MKKGKKYFSTRVSTFTFYQVTRRPFSASTDIFFLCRMNNTRKEKGVHETEMGRRDLKKKDNSPCLVFLHRSIQATTPSQ